MQPQAWYEKLPRTYSLTLFMTRCQWERCLAHTEIPRQTWERKARRACRGCHPKECRGCHPAWWWPRWEWCLWAWCQWHTYVSFSTYACACLFFSLLFFLVLHIYFSTSILHVFIATTTRRSTWSAQLTTAARWRLSNRTGTTGSAAAPTAPAAAIHTSADGLLQSIHDAVWHATSGYARNGPAGHARRTAANVWLLSATTTGATAAGAAATTRLTIASKAQLRLDTFFSCLFSCVN